MQERYTLKLEILTEALKSSINQVKGMIHKFTNDVQKDNKINLGQMSVGNLYGEIGRAQQKIKEFNEQIARDKKLGVDTTVAEGNVKRLKDFIIAANQRLTEMGAKRVDLSGLDKTKEKVEDIGNEAEDTKQKMSGISISANMTNNNIIDGFKNSWKSIKRFAFSLLSIRGIYGLVRKASSAYLSQDTQLANQMQKTWASLGALMAPILEKIVKGIRIAAAYVNYFVKALTGKDLIGKAVKKVNSYNKSLGGTAKAAKAVNKELTTMDEVTNLSFDDGSVNNFTDDISNAVSGFDDFGDIKLDPKITKFLDDLANKVKQVGKFLKPVIDWAIQHPGAVLTILGGAKLLSLVTKLTGTSGLGKLTGLLKGLATVGVVVAGVDLIYNAVTGRDLINDIKEILKGLKKLGKAQEENKEQAKGNKKATDTMIDGYNKQKSAAKGITQEIVNTTDSILRQNNAVMGSIKTFPSQLTFLGALKNGNKDVRKEIEIRVKEEKQQMAALKDTFKQQKLTNKEQSRYKEALIENRKAYKKLRDQFQPGTKEYKMFDDRVKELTDDLNYFSKNEYEAKVDVNIKEAQYNVNELNNNLTNKIKDKLFKAKTDVDTAQSTKNTNTLFSLLTTKIKDKLFKAKTDVDDKIAESKTKTLGNSLSNLAKTFTAKFKIDVGTQDAKNKIRNFFTSTNNLFKKGSALGGVVKAMNTGVLNALINAIPGYDVGTNYVPNDQLAMVHKGEAIVPKKFNNEQFFNNNNEETNALLVEVNQNLIELRNRPNVFEVNGKELAQATYSDFQNEGSRLNQSMTIKKVGGN